MFMSDFQRLKSMHYYNPNSPTTGGNNYKTTMVVGSGNFRWGKSVEVQCNQVNAVFKDLEEGDELAEADPRAFPCTYIMTMPHSNSSRTAFTLPQHRRLLPRYILTNSRQSLSSLKESANVSVLMATILHYGKNG